MHRAIISFKVLCFYGVDNSIHKNKNDKLQVSAKGELMSKQQRKFFDSVAIFEIGRSSLFKLACTNVIKYFLIVFCYTKLMNNNLVQTNL